MMDVHFVFVFLSQAEEIQIRKCSPFLESDLLPEKDVLLSTEWKVVPDIWRTSAEKFGDRVALVDPYHDPPTNLTYKQVYVLLILNFRSILGISQKKFQPIFSHGINLYCISIVKQESLLVL